MFFERSPSGAFAAGLTFLCALLLAAPVAHAQSQPTSRPATPTTPASKPAKTPASKPAATPASKPTATPASKPARPAKTANTPAKPARLTAGKRRKLSADWTSSGRHRRLVWEPGWRKFGTWEYVLTGIATATAVAANVIGPKGRVRRGGVLADESARGVLRLGREGDRRIARDASDLLLAAVVAYPYMIGSLLTATWYRRSPEIAWQMGMITSEVIAVTLMLQGLTTMLTSRERPYVRICGDERPANTRDCSTFGSKQSFFSGHSALSFAAASVMCMHHINLQLYGGRADAFACAGGLGVAATVALLRVMADMHYLSDVAVGTAVGAMVGFGLPYLLHYRGGAGRVRAASKNAPRGITLRLIPTFGGAAAVGTF